MGLGQRYKRWRHGRGYGVHSPLAYDLITNTLREHGSYYGYERLDAACKGSRQMVPCRLRLLLRLLARFNPSTVTITGEECVSLLRLAVKTANSRCKISKTLSGNEFIIINGEMSAQLPIIDKGVYFFINQGYKSDTALEELWTKIGHGIRLDNCRDMAIIISGEGLHRQRIDVKF